MKKIEKSKWRKMFKKRLKRYRKNQNGGKCLKKDEKNIEK